MATSELDVLQTQPFAGDVSVCETVAELARKHRIASIIETGTYHGATTRFLAGLGVPVLTVESDRENFAQACVNLADVRNATPVLGSSAVLLPDLIEHSKRPILFFLDAHWGKSWPLLDELAMISLEHGTERSVIVIHDFKVPGTDLGYDTYDGQDLDLEYVEDAINAIYCRHRKGWSVSYNAPQTAQGLRRGVAYFAPRR